MTAYGTGTGPSGTYTGANIKRDRKALDLTQAKLAVYLGVHRETVHRWEAGKLDIERPEQLRLAMLGLFCQASH